jgi:uncharacterized repeat protein (TIGR03803 family)
MKSLSTALVIALVSVASEAQESFQVLDRFFSEGDYPTGLVEGPDGYLYGTTAQGAGFNAGAVFRFDLVTETYEVLHSMTSSYSESGMVLGAEGMLYGTTIQGGAFGYGTVFRIDAQGNHTVIHTFDSATGAYPYSGLVLGSDGSLYGTTHAGGDFSGGTVYRIDPQGNHSVLCSFNPAAGDGSPFLGGLVEGSDGSFYGTTTNGGPSDLGTIYRVDGLGNYTRLHSFDVAGGGYQPYGALVLASDGNFYGTTNNGGAFGVGDVFRMDHQGNHTVIHSFENSTLSGYSPLAGLVEGSDGLLYGTTTNGGQFNSGTIFRINTTGSFELVHSFNGSDGYLPYEDPLIQASNGNLYGVSRSGGGTTVGTLFKITTGGTFTHLRSFGTNLQNPRRVIQGIDGRLYGTALDRGDHNLGGVYRFDLASSTRTVLHEFQANEGRTQIAGVIQASDGNFYGTTDTGGAEGAGTVFKLTPSGTHSILYAFLYTDGTGASPYGTLYQASDGNLYGMTVSGGAAGGYGTIFRLTLSGTHNLIYSFDFTDGGQPDGNLTEGSDGLLYGVTPVGGLNGLGTVFKVAKDGSSFAVIHSFGAEAGQQPWYAGLVEGSPGVFYGVSASGGASNYGVVYEITSDGEYTVLHSFDGTHGANPYGTLVLATDGRLYGTTHNGGYWGVGTLYRITTGGTHTVVHNFDGTNGANPLFGVIQGADGAFYGATSRGGYPYIDVLYRWADDTTPPETTIDSAPPAVTNARSASFEFTSNESSSTFECSLDGEPFTPCFTPHMVDGLTEAPHEFQVRAIDFLANVDPTPASHSWTVDVTPPETTITSAPPEVSNSTTASFEFTSSEPESTFECYLDGNPSPCASPKVYTGIGDGAHNFSVWAKDAAGNVDPDGAYHFWTIDTAAPETTVTSGPPSPTNSPNAMFAFFSSDPGATFECRLDGGAFGACASPHSYSGLAEGLHTFEVRSQGAGTNPDPTPATYQWVIDTTPPDTIISAAPPVLNNFPNASFEFTSSEGSGNFECSLDGAGFASCASPQPYSGLPDGPHAFLVRATDFAGNTDPTPAAHSWTVDTTLPETAITMAPAALTNSTSATFAFTSTEPGSTFECSIDAGAFAACTSPNGYSGLAEGSHNFLVRAVDSLGNTDPTPASHSWTIDRTPPDTTIVDAPPALSNASSATFQFVSTEPGTFECRLDGGSFSVCTTPLFYSGLADGPHTVRVRARDSAGNVDPAAAVHSWTIDTTAPDTTITFAPPALTNNTAATFAFTANDPASTFECSLDGAGFAPCTSPRDLSGLAEAVHNFQVRATNSAGNTDPTPAFHSWTIDFTPPDTTITNAPPAFSTVSTATFEFAASEPGTAFECSLDGGGFTLCVSPHSYSSLSDSAHSFLVRAIDSASNADPTPASHSWTVDATSPNTTITLSPPSLLNSASATFEFTANEAASGFECRIDAGGFAPCTSPQAYSGLSEGAHNFLVRATDSAGNVDPTPATHFWTVDTIAPDTNITSAPPAISNSASATFAFSASEPESSFECQLDSAGFAPCTSPRLYTGLAEGPHNVLVRAIDGAGNSDATPASNAWTVDTAAPDTSITTAPPSQTNQTGVTFEFTSSESGSVFECRLDAAGFVPCTSPQGYSNLSDGAHNFLVRATDGAGNIDQTPASHAWNISTTRRLTIMLTGTGTGTVTSIPAGIDCPGDCVHDFPFDTSATLTPAAASNSAFTGWTGDPDCSDGMVILDFDKTCTANFSAGGPDLVVAALSAPPAAAVPGSRFPALETTRNQGGSDARSSQTRLLLSTDPLRDPSDVLLNGAHAVPLLGPGAESTITVQLTIPAATPFGLYYLLACADFAARVVESNESNNCLPAANVMLVSRPDLRMTSFTGPAAASPGDFLSIVDAVENQGGIDARESRIRYYVSLDPVRDALDLRLGGARDVPLLTPGAVSTGAAAPTLSRTTPLGTYYLIACADDTSRVVESDEGNNCLVAPSTLLVTRPDLTITAFSAPPAATRGGTITLEDTAANESPVPSKSFSVRYYLSADAVRDALDFRFPASRLVGGLAAGGSSTGATEVTVSRSLLPGTYMVLACADDGAQVIEIDEGNNCRASEPVMVQ